MQKSAVGVVILICLYFISNISCKPTFSTTGPWHDTTIVYGLLDVNDTAHYIRIYKGYLNPNVNAYSQAKIADSIYYAPNVITATLYELDTTVTPYQIKKTIPLTRVDGNKEGLNMDTGVFAQSPNILYKTSAQLTDGAAYSLVIYNKKAGKTISAQTSLVGSLVTVVPGYNVGTLNFLPHGKTILVWNASANAATYNLFLTIHYKEMYKGDTQSKSVVWNILTNYVPQSSQPAFSVDGGGFYSILANSLSNAPDGMTRKFIGTDFQMTAGGKELYTYYQSAQANSGITQGQAVKGYTNIKNGVGLFSSRDTKFIPKMQITSNALDSLACTYPNLHFLNHLGKLCGQ